VIPIAETPEYSATFRTYLVLPENVGVTVVSEAQLRHTRMAEAVPVPFTYCAYGTKNELEALPTTFAMLTVVVLHEIPTITVLPLVVELVRVQAEPVLAVDAAQLVPEAET